VLFAPMIDRVIPTQGFGTHAHREFEIFSYSTFPLVPLPSFPTSGQALTFTLLPIQSSTANSPTATLCTTPRSSNEATCR
jgi:hypothetical protein